MTRPKAVTKYENYLDVKWRLSLAREIDSNGCWIWTRAKTSHGYGSFSLGGKHKTAHRASYEAYVGPIPEGMTIDHKCRVRACFNPDHLECVSYGENNIRALPYRSDRMGGQGPIKVCKHGHEYTPENTITHNNKRKCRACYRKVHNESSRRYYARLRERRGKGASQ